MQAKMRQHQLTRQQIDNLLFSLPVGHLGTINENGFPYVIPVHFVYINQKIYLHGLTKGQRFENILRNPKVCFEVQKNEGFVLNDMACRVNTIYESVVAWGFAKIVVDEALKLDVLNKTVEKYTPQLAKQVYSANVLNATGVIEIEIIECTGKYCR